MPSRLESRGIIIVGETPKGGKLEGRGGGVVTSMWQSQSRRSCGSLARCSIQQGSRPFGRGTCRTYCVKKLEGSSMWSFTVPYEEEAASSLSEIVVLVLGMRIFPRD